MPEAGLAVSLRLPCWELRESYIECLKDFQREDPARPVRWDWLENFDLYLDDCRRSREQAEEIQGRVPQTLYWIIYGAEAVGKLTLRHQLNSRLEKLGGHFGYEIRPGYRRLGIAKKAFALGLRESRARGATEVVVTCDDDNLGSIGVLEGNGGRLVETYTVENWPKRVRKYRFDLGVTRALV